MTYAAPPAAVAPQQPMMIQQPQMTSRDMPDPNAIEQQKKSYAASLDQQLKAGKDAIAQENVGRKKMLNDAAAQQKAMFILQVDQALKKDEMLADQEMNMKMLELERAAHEQRLALETQAANLVMEYNQKKTQEAFHMQNGMIVKAFDQAQMQIQSEAAKLQLPVPGQQVVAAQPAPVTYAAPPVTYAAPPTTYAAPVTYAAPGASYAAAPAYAVR
jgi:hypothetical protein